MLNQLLCFKTVYIICRDSLGHAYYFSAMGSPASMHEMWFSEKCWWSFCWKNTFAEWKRIFAGRSFLCCDLKERVPIQKHLTRVLILEIKLVVIIGLIVDLVSWCFQQILWWHDFVQIHRIKKLVCHHKTFYWEILWIFCWLNHRLYWVFLYFCIIFCSMFISSIFSRTNYRWTKLLLHIYHLKTHII